MNPITYYKLKRELRVVELQEAKESRLKSISAKMFKYFRFIFWKTSFLGMFAGWLNKQAFGTIVAVFTVIMFIAVIIANQLRYYYWQNIMRANYPNDVLVAVDKVLFVFNAKQVSMSYWVYTIVFIMILVSINKRYCSSKPQVVPRIRR